MELGTELSLSILHLLLGTLIVFRLAYVRVMSRKS